MNFYPVAALDDRLAFTKDSKLTIMAIPYSELLSIAYDCEVLAISYEYTRFTSTHKDSAILALINIDACCSIKEKDVALFAIRYLKLLHL